MSNKYLLLGASAVAALMWTSAAMAAGPTCADG